MRDRLPFTRDLPDFARVIWASSQAREVWGPRLQAVTRAWIEMERLSVVHRVRPSALLHCTPAELPHAVSWAAVRGLVLLPLTTVATGSQYSATQSAPVAGQPWQYRAALTRPEFARAWSAAWADGDDAAIGSLLGYPECCREFFQRFWCEGGYVDTTWHMAQSEIPADAMDVRLIEDAADPVNNILLRWLGVRAVSHLPCSFRCEPTRKMGEAILHLGTKHGFAQEVEWTREMLSWPVEWSALHGIAEIKTPVAKVSARTDATAAKYTVQLRGSSYPPEGATGNVFPYQANRGPRLTQSRSFQTLVQLRDTREWADNGFATKEAQTQAHAVLSGVLASHRFESAPTIMDLGCGNGELLRRIAESIPGSLVQGIEMDPDRVRRAQQRKPNVHVTEGDFLSRQSLWSGPYSVIIFMPGRLTEVDQARADEVRSLLLGRAESLLLYGYGDWITRYGSLANLCKDVGLPVPARVASDGSVAAGLVPAAVRHQVRT